MSTAYTSAKVKFTGNGSATEFGFDFPYKKESEIKVYLKRKKTTEDVLTQDVDYSFVSENTIKFPASGSSQTVLTSSDVLAIQRESDFESQYNFTNQQRLEPEEVMNSDDNLERQIQELKRDSDAAVKVPPTSDMTTDDLLDYLEVTYESKDEIKTVAQNMVDVNTVADSITNVDAVSGAIDNVAVVSGKLNEIQTVSDAANSVVLCATEIDSIIDAPNQAAAAGASASAALASQNAAGASAASSSESAAESANQAQASAASAAAAAASAAEAKVGLATDAEFSAGTATNKAPTVKQAAALLETKANIALGNLTTAGKSKIAYENTPSNVYVDLTLGATGQTYTAPATGWFVFDKISTTTQQYVVFTNITTGFAKTRVAVQNTEVVCDFFPVGKGEVVKIDWSIAGRLNAFRFYYAKGEV